MKFATKATHERHRVCVHLLETSFHSISAIKSECEENKMKLITKLLFMPSTFDFLFGLFCFCGGAFFSLYF